MSGPSASLSLHLGANEIGLALRRNPAEGPVIIDRLLVADNGRDGEGLLGAVDELLVSTGTSLQALALIAFAAGPGGFSRVRVACAVAQGLGMAAGCPLVPVNSLEALASAAVSGRKITDGTRIVALVDARMNEVYCATFVGGPQSNLVPVLAPALIKVAELGAHLDQWVQSTTPVLLCGDAWGRYSASQGLFPMAESVNPPADEIAAACLSLSDATQGITPASAGPIYLRDKVALNISEQAELRARNATQPIRP